MNTVNTFLALAGKIKCSVDLYNVGVEYDTVYHSSGDCQPEEGEEDN